MTEPTAWQRLTAQEKQALVKQALAEGLSYTEAAKRLGAPSKNAIAGVTNIIHGRKKRGTKRKPTTKQRLQPGPIKPRAKRPHPGLTALVPLYPPAEPLPPSAGAWEALPGSSPVAIADHVNGCRFPIGADLPFRYCNLEVKADSPYCETHSAIAFREPPPRKEKEPTL